MSLEANKSAIGAFSVEISCCFPKYVVKKRAFLIELFQCWDEAGNLGDVA